ncbi:MAG TPA: S8 family serine peptidase [Acidimicrobiia bacterium]|nr:S8 family serine peptidase [Acidimicrobiia bacterium]
MALTGAVLLGGGAAPSIVQAGGGQAPASTYLVSLRPLAGDSGLFAGLQARRLGLTVLDTYRHAVSGFAATMTPAAAKLLAANPLVASVQPDRPIRGTAQYLPHGVARVHADVSKTASIDAVDPPRIDVNVAVLDTGVDTGHDDLNVVGGYSCAKGRSYDDHYGHGTHAAGTIGALDDRRGVVGVAPGARIYGVKVLDDDANGTTRELLCGIEWVTSTRTDNDPKNDIDVANLSLGGVGSDDGNCGKSDSDVLHQAICKSVAAGVTYVVAAGNEYEEASRLIPAAYGEVITVSAVADADGRSGANGGSPSCRADEDDTFANFSNYGSVVDIAAPGVCIFSTMPKDAAVGDGSGYGTLTGTSFAAPHVAGAAALWISKHPGASPAEVRSALIAAGNFDWNDEDDPDGHKEPLVDVSTF